MLPALVSLLVAQVWLGPGDAVYALQGDRLTRIDLKTDRTSSFACPGATAAGPVTGGRAEIEVRTASVATFLDQRFRVLSRCALPKGWRFAHHLGLARGEQMISTNSTTSAAWASIDVRRCKRRKMPPAFNAVVGPATEFFFSANQKFVGIDLDPDVEVYSFPAMKKQRTEVPPPGVGSAKFGPHAGGLSDEGKVMSWDALANPCYAMDPLATHLEGSIYAAVVPAEGNQAAELRIESLPGPKPTCPVDVEDATVLSRLHFDTADVSIAGQAPGRLLVWVEHRLWLVKLARKKDGFDYREPILRELRGPTRR